MTIEKPQLSARLPSSQNARRYGQVTPSAKCANAAERLSPSAHRCTVGQAKGQKVQPEVSFKLSVGENRNISPKTFRLYGLLKLQSYSLLHHVSAAKLRSNNTFQTGINLKDVNFIQKFPRLFQRDWPRRALDKQIRDIDAGVICFEYEQLLLDAPRRDPGNKPYIVGHDGIPTSSFGSNRREEHIAIALVNMRRRWPLPKGGWFYYVDYQVPLKAKRDDRRIGKIDMIGLSDQGRIIVIELKVIGESGSISDAPPTALMEGLRYAAIVEANHDQIKTEIEQKFGLKVSDDRPAVLVLAEQSWWTSWLGIAAAGNWGPNIRKVADGVEEQLGLSVQFGALDNCELIYGADGIAPRLVTVPQQYGVSLGEHEVFGSPMSVGTDRAQDYKGYMPGLQSRWWSWVEDNCANDLDGITGVNRPPKFAAANADQNVSAPLDAAMAKCIKTIIPLDRRHQHFGSFRSSQALAQSVFGAVVAFERFDLLATVRAECGRSAFFDKASDCNAEFEHEVSTLGEPRPTSIDVLLTSAGRKIAVECKFTEAEFGQCSRPNLRPNQPSYQKQHCDGTYSRQNGRGSRCSLTEIGVQYWTHIPQLFDWCSDQDLNPCPLRGTYQLARNAIAALLDGEGNLDAFSGHMLFVYDARNPAYAAGGGADRQYEEISSASRHPGLIRRVTWQRMLSALSGASELDWLVEEMQSKHGLVGG